MQASALGTHAAQAAAQEECDRFCDDKEKMFRELAGTAMIRPDVLCGLGIAASPWQLTPPFPTKQVRHRLALPFNFKPSLRKSPLIRACPAPGWLPC